RIRALSDLSGQVRRRQGLVRLAQSEGLAAPDNDLNGELQAGAGTELAPLRPPFERVSTRTAFPEESLDGALEFGRAEPFLEGLQLLLDASAHSRLTLEQLLRRA